MVIIVIIIVAGFIEHLLSTSHYSKGSTCTNSYNSLNNYYYYPVYIQGKWSKEKQISGQVHTAK